MSTAMSEKDPHVAPEAVFDCLRCGLCCTTSWDIEVQGDEQVPEAMTRLDRIGIYTIMRSRKGMCIALKSKADGTCACRIYAQRPRVCRDFEPGNTNCLELRRKAGLDA